MIAFVKNYVFISWFLAIYDVAVFGKVLFVLSYFIFIYTFFDLKSTFLSLYRYIVWNYHFQEPIMGSCHFAVF